MNTRADWRNDAACRNADPDLFFPVGPAGPALDQVIAARQVCRGCPVQALCLDWALRHAVSSGIRGTTEAERRAIWSTLTRAHGRLPEDGAPAREHDL